MRLARRFILIVIALALLVVAGRLLMPFMGRRLIRSDSLVRSDLIVVLGSYRLERTLEAGMLYRQGWAPRIFLLRPPDLMRDTLRRQFGIHVPVFLDVQKDVLAQMGVPNAAVVTSSRTPDGTRDEARAVADYVRANAYRRIIVVTSPYHTRRAGSSFEDAAKGSFEVVVHPDKYEPVDPSRWWVRFPDRYEVVNEYMKTSYAWFW